MARETPVFPGCCAQELSRSNTQYVAHKRQGYREVLEARQTVVGKVATVRDWSRETAKE